MKTVSKALQENRDTIILLVYPIAILAKMIEHLILPDNYFYDSTRILGMILGKGHLTAWGGSYKITADLFRSINIFNFSTLFQWSLALGIVFNILFIVLFVRIKGVNLLQSFFALMSVGLCNIYVFNLGKDIIQFSFFVICITIIIVQKLPTWCKVIGCALVFYWESTFFRAYYIIMSVFVIAIFLIFSMIRKKNVKLNFWKILLVLAILYGIMYAFLNVAQVLMPDEYDAIMHCKDNTEYMTATTMIYDYIEFGTDVNLYIVNYIINSIRLIFPLELLGGGIFYLPFFAFQALLLYFIYRNIKNIHKISDNNVIALSVFVSFFMGSVLFEPDFGSFARHEAAAFPIIVLFALDNVTILNQSKENSNLLID